MDALTTSNLEDALHLEEKAGGDSWKRLEQNEYDDVWRHNILFNIRYQVSCDKWDFNEEDMEDPWKQVFDQEHRESLVPEEEILLLSIEERYLDRQIYE